MVWRGLTDSTFTCSQSRGAWTHAQNSQSATQMKQQSVSVTMQLFTTCKCNPLSLRTGYPTQEYERQHFSMRRNTNVCISLISNHYICFLTQELNQSSQTKVIRTNPNLPSRLTKKQTSILLPMLMPCRHQ